ncbi:MAG: catechol 2,3-dioxygenase-like lactoylglutathione lyase family enzyme [Chlamydiales bacterium]|jgi:catechol 2,3-dioxygenase-like lactoylglutathione lyase family enzyme
MARARFEAVHAVLPSQDVSVSLNFFITQLGFSLRFRDSPTEPAYAGVGRDGVELHIQWHDPAEWSAVERPMLRFVVPSIDELFEEYRDKGVFHTGSAMWDTAWGTRELAFYDPCENGLTFYRDR